MNIYKELELIKAKYINRKINFDAEDINNNQEEPEAENRISYGNTRLPYGLCKRFGIEIGKNWKPKDAWEALEGKGISHDEVIEHLKKNGTVEDFQKEEKDDDIKHDKEKDKENIKKCVENGSDKEIINAFDNMRIGTKVYIEPKSTDGVVHSSTIEKVDDGFYQISTDWGGFEADNKQLVKTISALRKSGIKVDDVKIPPTFSELKEKEKEKYKKATESAETFKTLGLEHFEGIFSDSSKKKKQFKLFSESINNVENRDKHIVKMFSLIGKMQEKQKLPIKRITFSKSNSSGAVRYSIKSGFGTSIITDVTVTVTDLSNEKVRKSSVRTMSHELAHLIDLLAGSKSGDAISKGSLYFATHDDGKCSKELEDKFIEIKNDYESIEKAFDNEWNLKWEEALAKSDEAKARGKLGTAYEIIKEYSSAYNKAYDDSAKNRRERFKGYCALSDIFDALNRGKGKFSRDGSKDVDGILMYGHGQKYYSSDENVCSEIFANYISLGMNDPDLLEILRKEKPQLCDELDKIVKDIIIKYDN